MDGEDAAPPAVASTSSPRITPDMLGAWQGKVVRLCGKVRAIHLPSLRVCSGSVPASACSPSAAGASGRAQISDVSGGTAMVESTGGAKVNVVDTQLDDAAVPYVEVSRRRR